MKRLFYLTIILAILNLACNNNYTNDKDLIPQPGLVYFELNTNVNFISAAYLLTDTLQLTVKSTQYINYKLDTNSASFRLDSIIKSKPYFNSNYTVQSIGTSAQTKDLEFVDLSFEKLLDWDTTVRNYKIEQVTSATYIPRGIINVPNGKEQAYIDTLMKHKWFFSKATLVYLPN